jgi:microtubule-associated protein-like 6
MKLKYAHGYRCKDTRGNLKYAKDGKIVYSTAALGIVLDKQTNVQEFFNLHQEDVISLAIHPNKEIVATGHFSAAGNK